MPNWPPPIGRRTVTFELPVGHIAHLDAMALHLGCSRAAYLRQLILRDLEAQQPVRRRVSNAG